MSSRGTDVRVSKARSVRHWIAGKRFVDRWHQLNHRWPMAIISVGVISSFVWAVLLVWLLLGVINRLL
jgi:hypothetical protein